LSKYFFNLGFIQISNIAVQLLLFPIILRSIGIESFGLVTVINAYSLLAGVFINYGTNQSGIKDIALVKVLFYVLIAQKPVGNVCSKYKEHGLILNINAVIAKTKFYPM
jgi:hypothetical protein